MYIEGDLNLKRDHLFFIQSLLLLRLHLVEIVVDGLPSGFQRAIFWLTVN
jgi:hypothetical protein